MSTSASYPRSHSHSRSLSRSHYLSPFPHQQMTNMLGPSMSSPASAPTPPNTFRLVPLRAKSLRRPASITRFEDLAIPAAPPVPESSKAFKVLGGVRASAGQSNKGSAGTTPATTSAVVSPVSRKKDAVPTTPTEDPVAGELQQQYIEHVAAGTVGAGLSRSLSLAPGRGGGAAPAVAPVSHARSPSLVRSTTRALSRRLAHAPEEELFAELFLPNLPMGTSFKQLVQGQFSRTFRGHIVAAYPVALSHAADPFTGLLPEPREEARGYVKDTKAEFVALLGASPRPVAGNWFLLKDYKGKNVGRGFYITWRSDTGLRTWIRAVEVGRTGKVTKYAVEPEAAIRSSFQPTLWAAV